MVQFSPLERRMLLNQYYTLKAVDPEYARYYRLEEMIEILEGGFEGQYDRILGGLSDPPLPEEECRLVEDVLVMCSTLMDYKDKSKADLSDYEQVGFDGNTESSHLAYAKFLFKHNPGGYPGITGIVNSHHGTLDHYRRTVEAWKATAHPQHLTEDDITRILAGGPILRLIKGDEFQA